MTDKIEVSQRAREAYLSLSMLPEFDAIDVCEGRWDKTTGLQAFARFERDILATRTDATPVAWMPMTSSPADEPILAAIKVNHKNGTTWWERHIIVIDSETGTISDMDFHHGWEAEDYEFWQPLPSAPDATYTHPPATDVAALVDALREAREALHFHYVEWDGEPDDAVPLQLARAKCDAALAPFTKGQP